MADPTDEPRLEEDEDGGGAVKSFLEHLEDLRWMLIKSGAALLIGMVVCLVGGDKVAVILARPVLLANQMIPEPALKIHLGFYGPATGFMSAVHLGFFGGIILSSPFIIYFVAEFVMPALKVKEKKYFLRAFFVGVLLFLGGVSFCYFLILPRALQVAVYWSKWLLPGEIGVTPPWLAEQYFGFVSKFLIGMGLGFELPVVLLALVKIGVLDYERLAGFRRYMIVINLILGAVLTTPEIFTQLVMAVPLQLLYEASVWIAWYWERDERRKARDLEGR